MTFIEKINKDEVFAEIILFEERYNIVPAAAVLAGIFKTTLQTIHAKLNALEEDGKIVQIKKIKNIVRYEVVKN